MANHKLYIRLLLPAAVVFSTACTDTAGLYNEYKSVPSSEWNMNYPIEFSPDSAVVSELNRLLLSRSVDNNTDKTSNRAILKISMRYSTLASVEQLPVEVLQEAYDCIERKDTLTFKLFEAESPTGAGANAVYTLTRNLPLTNSYTQSNKQCHPIPDGLRITLTPLSPTPVKGLISTGVCIEPE